MSRFGLVLVSVLGHFLVLRFRVVLGSFWCQFLGRFGVVLGQFVVLGSFLDLVWGRFRVVFGSFLGRFRVVLGLF